jgi:hypothetical protein
VVAHKFVRLGITEERFNDLLEAQGHACAICREPFGDKFPQADHDHNCHEAKRKARAKACEKCIRGLLCVRCNTHLGWWEARAMRQLASVLRKRPAPEFSRPRTPAGREITLLTI